MLLQQKQEGNIINYKSNIQEKSEIYMAELLVKDLPVCNRFEEKIMRFEYTDGCNKDFIELCHELDSFLNEIVGGEENRKEYIPYNRLDYIHDVIMAYDNDLPAGCASFKRYNAVCAEVKRVFLRKEYRGKGISKEMMKMLEERGRQKGFLYFILESGEPLVAAMALYRKTGYNVIPNYGQYRGMDKSVCMKKKL